MHFRLWFVICVFPTAPRTTVSGISKPPTIRVCVCVRVCVCCPIVFVPLHHCVHVCFIIMELFALVSVIIYSLPFASCAFCCCYCQNGIYRRRRPSATRAFSTDLLIAKIKKDQAVLVVATRALFLRAAPRSLFSHKVASRARSVACTGIIVSCFQ